jgi:succinate dehydrogenase/fumarate reductase cytochrome b subunit
MLPSTLKAYHYWTGLLLAVFILVHLANHLVALWSVPAHLTTMDALRRVYRHPVVETGLLLAVAGQIFTGLRLYWASRQQLPRPLAERIQLFSGLYLAFFLLVHTGAVLSGRALLGLDTNLYFAAAGVNTFPFSLFFVPYYFLAVTAIFLHVASLHYQKGSRLWGAARARRQALGIGAAGLVVALLILFAMTNRLQGLPIPPTYQRALGKS